MKFCLKEADQGLIGKEKRKWILLYRETNNWRTMMFLAWYCIINYDDEFCHVYFSFYASPWHLTIPGLFRLNCHSSFLPGWQLAVTDTVAELTGFFWFLNIKIIFFWFFYIASCNVLTFFILNSTEQPIINHSSWSHTHAHRLKVFTSRYNVTICKICSKHKWSDVVHVITLIGTFKHAVAD